MKHIKIVQSILISIISIFFINTPTISTNTNNTQLHIEQIEKFNQIYKNQYFYITKTGKKFHRAHCHWLKISKNLTNFEDIDNTKIVGPCETCFYKYECDIYYYCKNNEPTINEIL